MTTPTLLPLEGGGFEIRLDSTWTAQVEDGRVVFLPSIVELATLGLDTVEDEPKARKLLELIAVLVKTPPDIRMRGGQDLPTQVILYGPPGLKIVASTHAARILRAMDGKK